VRRIRCVATGRGSSCRREGAARSVPILSPSAPGLPPYSLAVRPTASAWCWSRTRVASPATWLCTSPAMPSCALAVSSWCRSMRTISAVGAVACEKSPQNWPRSASRSCGATLPRQQHPPHARGLNALAEHMVPAYGGRNGAWKGRLAVRHRQGRALDRHFQDIRFYIAELKTAQKRATAVRVDMRHCMFLSTSPML
jgi:hypothetical protein